MGSSSTPPGTRQPYYPPLDSSIPPAVASHLKLIYTGLNQHDQAIMNQAQSTATASASKSTSPSTGGGATGTITLAALTISGAQGSLTIDNGLITSYTNPT